MNDGNDGRRPARRWPGSGAGPRGRPARSRAVSGASAGERLTSRPSVLRRARVPGARRPAVLAAALAGIALLAAACSGGAKPASAALTNYQKALAYSQCMRAHGEPGFPDPQPNGDLLINGPKDHLNGALMNSAGKACQHLMPKSPPLTAAQQQQLVARTLKFVACMRAHGLPAFPDPKVSAGGIEMQLPRNIMPNSAVFKNAQQACKNLIPFGRP